MEGPTQGLDADLVTGGNLDAMQEPTDDNAGSGEPTPAPTPSPTPSDTPPPPSAQVPAAPDFDPENPLHMKIYERAVRDYVDWQQHQSPPAPSSGQTGSTEDPIQLMEAQLGDQLAAWNDEAQRKGDPLLVQRKMFLAGLQASQHLFQQHLDKVDQSYRNRLDEMDRRAYFEQNPHLSPVEQELTAIVNSGADVQHVRALIEKLTPTKTQAGNRPARDYHQGYTEPSAGRAAPASDDGQDDRADLFKRLNSAKKQGHEAYNKELRRWHQMKKQSGA